MSGYPVWDADDIMIDAEEETLEEVESYAFDYGERKTVVTGSGKTVRSDAREAYIFWAVKCVATERGAHEAYSEDFGAALIEIMRLDLPRPLAESEIEREIKEALMVDNRTVNAFNFRFDWETDSCYISFEIEHVYGIDTITAERGGYSSGRIN
ncbi:hypothetical protein A0U40_18450 [[Bacillus] sp. KCTC 13219]|nr:hypothetical protein A0U40_18450 [[Bacillus] sp. KCTC 13219]